MKAVILAGGLGTRIAEETIVRPKPMIEIGGFPMIWHILKIYSHFGINDFIVCLGYKGYIIKEYFSNYFLHTSNVTFDLQKNQMEVHERHAEPWRVTLVDTGENTMTGGRVRRVRSHLADEEIFCLTYGDGLSNVNVQDLIAFHRQQGTLATVTAAQPAGRYGALDLEEREGREGRLVKSFHEKPPGDGAWINGGFFVMSPRAIDQIEGDDSVLEHEVLEGLARSGQLSAYLHRGFWQPMDTLRDKNLLEELWSSGKAPWKIW
jgi:glucose-1-phosphate cytidylyltransferase